MVKVAGFIFIVKLEKDLKNLEIGGSLTCSPSKRFKIVRTDHGLNYLS